MPRQHILCVYLNRVQPKKLIEIHKKILPLFSKNIDQTFKLITLNTLLIDQHLQQKNTKQNYDKFSRCWNRTVAGLHGI